MSAHTPGPWLVHYERDAFDSAQSILKVTQGNSYDHPQARCHWPASMSPPLHPTPTKPSQMRSSFPPPPICWTFSVICWCGGAPTSARCTTRQRICY